MEKNKRAAAAEWKWRFVVRYVACTTRSAFRHKSSSFATFLRMAAQTYGPSLNDFCEDFSGKGLCFLLLLPFPQPRRLMLRTLLNHCLSSAFKQEASKARLASGFRGTISLAEITSHSVRNSAQCQTILSKTIDDGLLLVWAASTANKQDLHALILC